MCDMTEEEWAEYLLWLEAARAVARVPRSRSPSLSGVSAETTPATAEAPA